MRMITRICCPLLTALSLQAAPAARFVQDQFVIGMWVPPATQERLDEHYRDIAEAKRHIEIFEFLLEVAGRRYSAAK